MDNTERIRILETLRPGGTPLWPLPRFAEFPGTRLWAKLEGSNPSGSSKDRPAWNILYEALKAGEIREDATLLESTSGNMAIALGQYARRLKMKLYCVTDDRSTGTNQRIMDLLKATGKMVPVGNATDPVQQRMEEVDALRNDPDGNYFWTCQYRSERNPASYDGVAAELKVQIKEKGLASFDYIFVPVSTGGSAHGIRLALPNYQMSAKVMMVDAVGSAATHIQAPAKRFVSGFGSSCASDFLMEVKEESIWLVSDAQAIGACHRLKETGFLAGGSSGAVVAACHKFLQGCDPVPSDIVLFFPDRGERYLDTIYSDDWLNEHAFDRDHSAGIFGNAAP